MRCMSTAKTKGQGEQTQTGLFGDGELAAVRVQGAPRVMSPVRDQVELRPVDLDALLTPDHPARTVWAFVQAMKLAPLYARIKSAGSRGGAPGHRPGDSGGVVAVGHHRRRGPGARSTSCASAMTCIAGSAAAWA